MYTGKLIKFDNNKTKISLTETDLECKSCGGNCHELLVVPKHLIGKGNSGTYKIVRCLNCIFWGEYIVYFEGENATHVYPPNEYECHDFIEDQCDKNSIASIEWIEGPPQDKDDYTPTISGSEPKWIQESHNITCPECGGKMEFILQLSSDSIDTCIRNNDLQDEFSIEIEYYATLYYFYCNKCDVSCSLTQNT